MRMCVVCHEASLTGAPRIGFDIAAHLARDHEVTLLAKKGGPLIDHPQYAELRHAYRVLNTNHEVCDDTYRQRVTSAVELLGELQPDLLYVNSVASGEWCEAGRQAEVPVVLHTHETRDSLPSLLSSVCTPRVLRFADLLVGASEQALDDIETLTNTRAAGRLGTGIFVDADAVYAGARQPVPPAVNANNEELTVRGERRIVAMCGLAQRRKGADIFLALAARLPQYDFVWIGPWTPAETDLNGATHSRFRALRLRNFFYTRLTDNPYAHLESADAFVLTSREDPNPLVVAEALLLGCKVLAFAETGASVAMLERFGYAFTGAPDAERLAAILPRILDVEPGAWHAAAAEGARALVDGAGKLAELQETLERLVEECAQARSTAEPADRRLHGLPPNGNN